MFFHHHPKFHSLRKLVSLFLLAMNMYCLALQKVFSWQMYVIKMKAGGSHAQVDLTPLLGPVRISFCSIDVTGILVSF
jgi:hypothetical protein